MSDANNRLERIRHLAHQQPHQVGEIDIDWLLSEIASLTDCLHAKDEQLQQAQAELEEHKRDQHPYCISCVSVLNANGQLEARVAELEGELQLVTAPQKASGSVALEYKKQAEQLEAMAKQLSGVRGNDGEG